MYLLHLRPLFVELPIFVLRGLVLLEPRDLVREQTRRNLRCAAADLRKMCIRDRLPGRTWSAQTP